MSCCLFAQALMVAVMVRHADATATTHIWGPSTDVQPYGLFHLTSDVYLPVERDALGNRIATLTDLGLTAGVLPFKDIQAEVGLDHKTGLGDLDDHPLYGNVKIGVPEATFATWSPALAVGVFDAGTESDETNFNVFYVKAARTVTAGKTSLGRLSLGYFVGNEDLLVDGAGEKDNSGVLATWERTMSEWSDRLWLCVDYMGSESVYGTFNAGLAWKFASNVAVLGAIDIFNNTDLASTTTVQVDIDF
jgi:hypothetical protein